MAVIVAVAAGFLGLVTAVLAMVIFQANAMTALALWSSIGLSATLLALAWSRIPRHDNSVLQA
ncbi:MAG: hypothetical protein WAT09_09280 [Paracoccaceae bacterium]